MQQEPGQLWEGKWGRGRGEGGGGWRWQCKQTPFFIYQKVVDDYNDDNDDNNYNDDSDVHTNTFVNYEDNRIIDLFCSDLIVHGVNVDVGEEGGQGDQQRHLKIKSQIKL